MKLQLIEPKHVNIYTWAVKEIEPGRVAEVTITPHKPYKERSNRLYLYFNTGLSRLPEFYVPGHLYVKPRIEMRPSLGMRIISGKSTDRYVRRGWGRVNIKYNGQGKMQIKSAIPSDPAIKVEIVTYREGRSYYIKATIPDDYEPDPDRKPTITVTTDVQEKPIEFPIRVIKPRRPTTSPTQPATQNAG